ncbi:bifunctional ADP-dependent NAD(P)H-hydrate dehydratase/NAD(P)H-hydrate epimerase [Paludibacter jiangxiensis]|uniref:Bifunctional NAD(P)H-hydrate repair enzyme n=1 Tax=Paludibacter jiangxiensis TaxID=681398 RepID=A0A161LEP4_9BACT|nr:bifunctional ADP-dependent NAD(P)H-hydrate dehydratase/NAD(P)H-hydrate epimerase [Paludibacter jiangxiensis]GAT63195.1 NAD(P)H-hydrate epimerase [Paludibacter jiangxiensis]
MKIPASYQIKGIDAYTIEHEPVSSADLMMRAAGTVAEWLWQHVEYDTSFKVMAGNGNNGGDALVVAMLLAKAGFNVECFLFNYSQKLSPDCAFYKEEIAKRTNLRFAEVTDPGFRPDIKADEWVIDGLFGTGLNRPLEEPFVSLIRHINTSDATVVSIDIPSGLFGEDNRQNNPEHCIHATYTLSFQFPKLAFLFAENSKVVGDWQVLPIGLHPKAIEKCQTAYNFATREEMAQLLKPKDKFAHKGIFGHALLAGGSKGKIGAIVLAAKSCLRSGVGLLTVQVPASGNDILQISVPEAMTIPDEGENTITAVQIGEKINAVGIGCGMGTSVEAAQALHQLLQTCDKPMEIDADALNILAQHPEWIKLIPTNSILTPHPAEFDRLAGKSATGYERLEKARDFAAKNKVTVVLKGAYTAVINADGEVSFNSTGNPGMATAGSGDTLTGILVALQAQGYQAFDAARLGVFLHGLAGDIAARTIAFESITASDITASLGFAFNELRSKTSNKHS